MNRLALIVSIVMNLALVGMVAVLLSGQKKASPPPSAAPPEAVVPVSRPPETAPPPSDDAPAPAAAQRFDWRSVESEDYKQYIANLRSIGCPEETIRDIIRADVNKLFDSRAKAERGGTNKFEYWKGDNPFAALFNEESISKQQALAKEKRELLRELLGGDVADKPDPAGVMAGMNPFETMLDFIPSDKQTRLMELEQKFAGKLMDSMKGMSKGDTGAMRKVLAEKEAEMLGILTPEEKLEYDLRMSQTAMMMRMQMGDFEMSEQEFRDVFKLRKDMDDRFGIMGMGGTGKADAEQRAAAQRETDVRIREILGDRYAEYKYEMGGEWAAQMLHRISKENNVSRENALKAYEITDLARAEAEKLKADTAMDAARRQAALQAIHDETAKAVTEVLGQTAAADYLKKVALIPGVSQTGNK